MQQSEMVIFTRTFDLLTWLLPATNSFPRAHRHTFTQRLLDAAFDLRERLEEANLRKGRARLERLHLADEALARVRLYTRLAAQWQWLTPGQYQHSALIRAPMPLNSRQSRYRAVYKVGERLGQCLLWGSLVPPIRQQPRHQWHHAESRLYC